MDGKINTTPHRATQHARTGKLIDVDAMEIKYSGLDYIDPLDKIAIAHYFVAQVRNQPAAEAIPIDFIRERIRETAGAESAYLSRLIRRWEEEQNDLEHSNRRSSTGA